MIPRTRWKEEDVAGYTAHDLCTQSIVLTTHNHIVSWGVDLKKGKKHQNHSQNDIYCVQDANANVYIPKTHWAESFKIRLKKWTTNSEVLHRILLTKDMIPDFLELA